MKLKEYIPSHKGTSIPGVRWALPALLVFPILIYFVFFFIHARNYPQLDDYDTVLKFLIEYMDAGSFLNKVNLLIGAHNDHRIAFSKIIIVVQYLLSGGVNFTVLAFIGNLSFVLIFLLLTLGYRPSAAGHGLLLFVPVSYLLFHFRHYEGILWPMVSLSGFWVLPFCLLGIYFLSCAGKRRSLFFSLAVFFSTLACFTQGNGKLIWPMGVLLLWTGRTYKRLLIWIIFGGCVVLFDYLYQFSNPRDYGTLFQIFRDPRPVISFLGAILFRSGASVLGVCFLVYFIFLTWIRYFLKNPFFYFSMATIILNALAVGYARPDLNFPSRYSVYSTVFLALCYLSLVEILYAGNQRKPGRLFRVTALGVISANLFSYGVLSLPLGYYRAMVLNYEKNSILAYVQHPRPAQEDPAAIMKKEVQEMTKNAVFRLLPSASQSFLDTRMQQRADFIGRTEQVFTGHSEGFSRLLIRAREKGIYNYSEHVDDGHK